MRARNTLLMAMLAGLSWGCDTREAFPDPGLLPVVLLDVANENAHDVDVYVLQGGQRLRVARLWAGEDGEVEIGPPLVETGDFVLEAHAIGVDSGTSAIQLALLGFGTNFGVKYGYRGEYWFYQDSRHHRHRL